MIGPTNSAMLREYLGEKTRKAKDKIVEGSKRFKGFASNSAKRTGSYLKGHPTTIITGASLLLGATVLGLGVYGIYRGAKAGIDYMNSPSESEQSTVYETVPNDSSTDRPTSMSIQEIVFQTKPAEKIQPEFKYSGTAVDPQTGKNFRFFYAENVPSLLDSDAKVNEVEFRDSDNFNISYRIEDLKDKVGLDSLRTNPCSLESMVPETAIVGRNGRISGKYTVTGPSDRFAMIYKAAVEKSLEESSK